MASKYLKANGAATAILLEYLRHISIIFRGFVSRSPTNCTDQQQVNGYFFDRHCEGDKQREIFLQEISQ